MSQTPPNCGTKAWPVGRPSQARASNAPVSAAAKTRRRGFAPAQNRCGAIICAIAPMRRDARTKRGLVAARPKAAPIGDDKYGAAIGYQNAPGLFHQRIEMIGRFQPVQHDQTIDAFRAHRPLPLIAQNTRRVVSCGASAPCWAGMRNCQSASGQSGSAKGRP